MWRILEVNTNLLNFFTFSVKLCCTTFKLLTCTITLFIEHFSIHETKQNNDRRGERDKLSGSIRVNYKYGCKNNQMNKKQNKTECYSQKDGSCNCSLSLIIIRSRLNKTGLKMRKVLTIIWSFCMPWGSYIRSWGKSNTIVTRVKL